MMKLDSNDCDYNVEGDDCDGDGNEGDGIGDDVDD
jgi:hypothetical protein